jgi:hypothetical protein
LDLQGIICEFGVFWGNNLALLETFRGMYEPYNYTRKIVGFDTFSGFPHTHEKNGKSKIVKKGSYSTTIGYEYYLGEILDYHEKQSPISHLKNMNWSKGTQQMLAALKRIPLTHIPFFTTIDLMTDNDYLYPVRARTQSITAAQNFAYHQKNIFENRFKTRLCWMPWGTCIFAAALMGACLLIVRFLPAESIAAQDAQDQAHSETTEKFTFDGTLYEEYSETLKTAASSYAQKKDEVLLLYRASPSRTAVEWFFAHITENTEISSAILEYADANDISPSLAFALAYTESRYKPTAVNRNANGTIDRGLFQLNSASFPRLTEADFFNPKTSARYGLSHLKYCLSVAENEVAALAMYNAGITRIKNDTTPRRTLNYISYILHYRQVLDQLFKEEIALFFSESANPIVAANAQMTAMDAGAKPLP